MQYFILSNPTEIELRYLMDCREFLQVTTLTDITSADGKEIMLQVWQGRFYKRKVFSFSWPRQHPRKYLDWNLLRQTLAPMIHNTANRTLKYPLIRWEKEALYHWKWCDSITANKSYTRHGQVYYVMINRGSRYNEGNFITTT